MPWCLWAGSSSDTPGEGLPFSIRRKDWEGSSFPEGIGLSPSNGWAWHGPWLLGVRKSVSQSSPCLTEDRRDMQVQRTWNRQYSHPYHRRFVLLTSFQGASGIVPDGHRHPTGQRLGLQEGLGVLTGHSWRMDLLGQVTTLRHTELISTANPSAMAQPAPEL